MAGLCRCFLAVQRQRLEVKAVALKQLVTGTGVIQQHNPYAAAVCVLTRLACAEAA